MVELKTCNNNNNNDNNNNNTCVLSTFQTDPSDYKSTDDSRFN